MKNCFRKTLSLFLAASILCSVSLTAAASDAMGEDLTAKDTLLHQETQLSTNTFWSTAYNDLRTENLITYVPNGDVKPIVTYGETLTDRTTVTAAARALESQGYRVAAGINGDFYNVNTGLPIGLVVTEGELRSSDGGYYAMGFRADGTAAIGKPGVKVSVDLGYTGEDADGIPLETVRQLGGVNKARTNAGGIYLYTYDFNAKHTTGTTEAGVDVLCTIQEGRLSIGETMTAVVERVEETASATEIRPDQIVFSANLKADAQQVDALRNIPEGTVVTLEVTAADEAWNDVEYAVGALYSLVADGAVTPGLPTGANPRTAVGRKYDGTLVFYTIDGRRSGHSVGASMEQIARRMIELGCEDALCLDGGGSTTLAVTAPDKLAAGTVNRPSDGSERKVSNQVLLVADGRPTGELSHFYVQADSQYVLAGSSVGISASAVDTNFIPMEEDYRLSADSGELEGHVLTTPRSGGEVTVTARSGRSEGETTVYAVADPTAVAIRDGSGAIIQTLGVAPGSTTQLTGSASYNHISLKADPTAFTWTVEGGIGTIDQWGNFTAAMPGQGSITASAGGQSATVQVTVSGSPLRALEDFEDDAMLFRGTGEGTVLSRTGSAEYVRLGRSAGKWDYTLDSYNDFGTGYAARAEFTAPVTAAPYDTLSFWVYGDGSGNTLSLQYSDSTRIELEEPITALDFTGWRQVTVSLAGVREIEGLRVSRLMDISESTGGSGTIYLDHLVLSQDGVVDNQVPTVTIQVNGTSLTGTVADAVDGVPAKACVSVAYDGKAIAFTYSEATGALSAALPAPDGAAHRVTVTARDVSGNIGRASYDIAVGEDWTPAFADTSGYWAATYVDYLYTAGITTGYADGTFRPNQNITRAQFAVMLYRYLGLDESQYAHVVLPFADTGKIPDYAVPAIRALYTEGVINGSTGKDGRLYFNPGSSLTRAQAAAMIGRTQERGYAAVSLTFSDAGKIPAYAAYYIQTMAAQGILGGYGDNTFKPNSNITRGQMAKILYNLM